MKQDSFKPAAPEIAVAGQKQNIEATLGREHPVEAMAGPALSNRAVPDKNQMSGAPGAGAIPVAQPQGPAATVAPAAPGMPLQQQPGGAQRIPSRDNRFAPAMGGPSPERFAPAPGGQPQQQQQPPRQEARFVPSAEHQSPAMAQAPQEQPAADRYIVRLEGVGPDGQTYSADTPFDFPVGTRMGQPQIIAKA